jgi:hypothetical protein
VNCVVIVCLFDFRQLDNNESKENGSRSQPSNGDGDYKTRDEDEECYDISKQCKPSFESYPNTYFSNCILTCFQINCMIELLVLTRD